MAAQQPTPAHPFVMASTVSAQPAADAASSAPPPTEPSTTPLPPPIFTTARLLIRPLHPSDAPSMSHHANNPLVAEHMSLTFPSPYTLDSARTWISMNLSPPHLNWGICLLSSPESVIGGCGLKPGVDVQSHVAEIGFWIGAAFWGKGMMTEVLDGMVEWVFSSEEAEGGKVGLREGERWTRVWGGVFGANKGSQRCFEKGGFVKEGVLRGAVGKRGREDDLVVFGLLKGEWEERRGRKGGD